MNAKPARARQHRRLPAGLLLAAAPAAFAGAQTPPADAAIAVAPFPEAVVVASSPPEFSRSHAFVTGRVERSRRELRIDRSTRVAANLARATYRTPPGTRLPDVVAHYRAATADFRLIFSCQGRDCGRNTAWANDVFGVKELVAPDAAQFYLAAATPNALVAVYVVQKGNRRVYAHVEVAGGEGIGALVAEDPRAPDPPAAAPPAAAPAISSAARVVLETLRRQGYVVLANAAPDDSGRLSDTALDALDAAATALRTLPRQVYVVCHMDGEVSVAQERSQACAEQGAARLRAAGVDAKGFGAGPFLPRRVAPSRRLELVAPAPAP